MKTLNHFLIFSAIFSGTILGGLTEAHAEKMSAQTQDMVIERMERVISAMDKKDASWVPSQQRLADLLSERARARFMLEVEANCNNACKGSKADRLKAVSIYETLLKEVKVNDHGPILFQLAHLYDMAGQPEQAIKLFERIIKEAKSKKISADIVARSHVGLADLLFQKGKFKEAHQHYTIALKNKNLQGRGLAIYNMAWCEFNLDRLNAGVATLEGLLRNPNLIARENSEGVSKYDPVFHNDIIRDLATFYARRPITNKELNNYEAFSPQDKRKELLLHFASEADRLGQKPAASVIYNRYLDDPNLTDEERLTVLVKLAQVNYDRGDTAKSTKDFARAAEEFQKICKDKDKCQELEKTMKRYVTELHRLKKLKPDNDLLSSYVIYNKTFPNDVEMSQRGAQVSDEMGRYAVAVLFARSISDNKNADEKTKKKALDQEISSAEKSKDPVLQKAAYEHYLALFPKGEKSFQVRYQLAYLSYQKKNFSEAAPAFNTLALDKNGTPELRKKSADLALDSLVQLKRDELIEEWAWEYSTAFPKARAEYETIARKALLNRTERIANNEKSSTSELKTILGQMQKANMASATTNEKIIFYTNMSVVAHKLNEDEIYTRSLQALFAQPGLTEARREQVMGQLVSYHEKKLDFKAAYYTALKMKFPKTAPKDREMKLGTLADLAGLKPQKHYKAALSAGLKGEGSRAVRTRLVLLSSNPVRELKAQAPELARDPALLNETTMLVYARTGDKKGLKSVLAMRELRRQSAPNFMAKQEFYSQMEGFKNRIARHKLNGANDYSVQKTIKARIKLLKEADRYLADSLRFKDVTAQLMALNVVGTENERTVRELVALPIPKKLKPHEQKQYLEILKQQSRPYFMTAKVAQQKENEIWERSSALPQLLKEYNTVRPELKKLLRRELQLLANLPNNSAMHSNIVSALNESTLSANDLTSARQAVAQNPENVREIENLKNLETKIGHPLMASYLESRLSQIQRGKSL